MSRHLSNNCGTFSTTSSSCYFYDWSRYRPFLSVSFLQKELGFKEGEEELSLDFFGKAGLSLVKEESEVDCKASTVNTSAVATKSLM